MCPNLTNPVVESKKDWVITMMVGYILVMFIIGYCVLEFTLYRKEDNQTQRERRHSIAGKLLNSMGLFSLFVLYFLVLWTGGLSISPFSGYFIYTPVVVYLAFRNFKKARLAVIAAIILAVFSTPIIINPIINLFIRSDLSTLKSVTPWMVTAEYQLHYLIVVITQVIASMLVALTSKSSSPSENANDSAAPPEN